MDEGKTVGGKCKTLGVGDHELDVGAIYVLPNCPRVKDYAKRAGVSIYEAFPFVHATEDSLFRPFGMPVPHLTERVAEFARLGRVLLRCRSLLFKPLGEIDERTRAEVAMPFSQWVEDHGLNYFLRAAYPLLRSFGFGYEEQGIPAAYVVNSMPYLARGSNPLSLWDLSGVRLFHVEGGFGGLWHRLSSPLDQRLGVAVTKVERSGEKIAVHRGADVLEFDRLIIACPLSRARKFIDCTSEEDELFSKIRTFDVWQVAVRITGLPHAVIIDRYHAWLHRGGPMIAFRYHPELDWYYLFGYAQEDFDGARALEVIQVAVAELGGRIEGEALLRHWPGYFPHYGTVEFASGYHARLEALQGLRSTYYTGEIMSNIGVEAVIRYSEQLMRRCFS